MGYEAYVDLVRRWLPEQSYRPSPITFEQQRAEDAIARASSGQDVALIGSGDAGVYGLAGLVLQLLARADDHALRVEIVPGVTAALSAAALLGAPLGHDFAAVSLSDLLTPWDVIEARLRACAEADFVTILYNPASRSRRRQLHQAQAIFLACRPPATPVGLVSSAFRDGQTVALTTLADLKPDDAGMLTTIVIGNRATTEWNGG